MRDIAAALELECEEAYREIEGYMKEQVRYLGRDGVAIGLSGGIDSALTAVLATKVLGPDHVLGLIMPDKESPGTTIGYARELAQSLNIKTITIDITPVAEQMQVYSQRDLIIKTVFPQYGRDSKFRIYLDENILESPAEQPRANFCIEVEIGGELQKKKLEKKHFLGIIGASHTKLRIRMALQYFHAYAHNYAVAGTTNRTEYELGDFCKYGNGGVDFNVIAHLYKTQVFQLSRHFKMPEKIIDLTPSPDLFSLKVSDEEFYFRLPFELLDRLLCAIEKGIPTGEVTAALGLTEQEIMNAEHALSRRKAMSEHLRNLPPNLLMSRAGRGNGSGC